VARRRYFQHQPASMLIAQYRLQTKGPPAAFKGPTGPDSLGHAGPSPISFSCRSRYTCSTICSRRHWLRRCLRRPSACCGSRRTCRPPCCYRLAQRPVQLRPTWTGWLPPCHLSSDALGYSRCHGLHRRCAFPMPRGCRLSPAKRSSNRCCHHYQLGLPIGPGLR
jgi:hypothetical protein